MGNLCNSSRQVHCEIHRMKYRNLAMTKKVWEIIDKDIVYYGASFCTTLISNHPQYAKYFEDEALPEFVQESRVKQKFTRICGLMSTLFVNHYDKPRERDYLLSYIAMVHKDMGLSRRDLENFLSDLLEMIINELPDVANAQYALNQMKCFIMLTERMLPLMEEHRRLLASLEHSEVTKKDKCLPSCLQRQKLLFGYPLSFWVEKRRYWEYRKAMWSTMELEMNSTSKRKKKSPKLTLYRRVHGEERDTLSSNYEREFDMNDTVNENKRKSSKKKISFSTKVQ